ncbi:SLC13 family permease [Catenovulum maritimum]|uniref:SLC13 family permease n=1 Tax=Catenovulum maritimum TaxID=1513271 RepID=UPI000AE9BA42|nr:SLC13 family permease [Catenovulum maritimum]
MINPLSISAIILAATFIGIFTEQFHGIERAKFAMAGAGAIIIAGQVFGFYSPELALAAIDWNVVFLLAIMMIMVSIMASTGGFEHIAQRIGKVSNGNQFKLIILLGSVISLISLVLDNVTTVIIFGPLIVIICQRMAISPVPYLFTAALLSNAGGVATLVGDPPNLMIGSAAKIDFSTFFIHMAPPVLFAWLAILLCLKRLFSEDLSQTSLHQFSGRTHYTNRRLWRQSLRVMLLMVVLFVIHHHIGWQPWLVAAACLTLLIFIAKKVDLEEVSHHIETPMLIFFISLFILIGGVEHSGLLHLLGEKFKPIIINYPIIAALLLLWIAAILSALIDNIPFTAAMIPVLLSLDKQGINVSVMWWALALGVGMGGNGSHIGSTANVYIVTLSERISKQYNKPEWAISPSLWFKKGLPVMFVSLVVCSLFIYFGYDFLYVENF